jgi:hypothetical protein
MAVFIAEAGCNQPPANSEFHVLNLLMGKVSARAEKYPLTPCYHNQQ